jgi:phosphoglycolate phosphatase-like HAD superfamily hydrolase
MDYQEILKTFQPAHEFFIGIDSDGCVFDTMEVKQKEFFIPNALKYFDLYSISGLLRETWEYVNLYSIHRGGNRFSSILKVFDLLNENSQIKNSTLILPDMSAFRKWVETETKLSNATLRKYFESNYDPGIEKVLKWSEAVNDEIGRLMPGISPFPNALKAIKEISVIADLVIVSQTPFEALDREWQENDIKKFARTIAGQEHGTKTEHLTFTAKGKYPDYKILMIGDAKGDLDAATNNNVLFYPIIPGKEDESWKYFLDAGLNKFINGSYRGTYEESLINEFLKSLPSAPPWHK